MHELSIAQSIINSAEENAAKHQAREIEEIELEIGCLAGIEIQTLEFALKSAVKGTILENTKIVRHDIAGEGLCSDCGCTFQIHKLLSECPECGSFLIIIRKGKELRIKSIVIK